MKKYRSRFLKTLALAYLAFPVVYLVLSVLFFDVPVSRLVPMVLSPFFYILCFWAVLTGYGLWEMKRWGWYLFVFTNVLIVYENASIVANYAETHHRILSFIFSVFVIIGVTYRVTQELRVPYFLPRVRWWEANSSDQFSVPVGLLREDGQFVQGQILDWSLKGCFIKTKEFFATDERLSLVIHVFGQVIQWRGVVVWKTRSTVTLPNGVGVKFLALPRAKKKKLKITEKRVRKLLALYRNSSNADNRDEFLKILDELRSVRIERAHFDVPDGVPRKEIREMLGLRSRGTVSKGKEGRA